MKERALNFDISENTIIVGTGLGIGEETKGSTVEWLSKEFNAHTVLRSGGSQAGHHVMTEDGREQMFSHFGCGTFDGTKTYLKNMVIEPVDLFTEAIEIEEKGVKNPFDLITIDKNCLVTTPFHRATSKVREILRGNDKKGTVGKGVGEAIRDSKNPELTIRAGDFFDDEINLINKLETIRKYKLEQVMEILKNVQPEDIPERFYLEMETLYDKDLVNVTAESYKYIADLVKITDEKYFEELLAKKGVIVCEASHGALLHPWYGFVPHVTQIDPTAQDVLKDIKEKDSSKNIVRLGISRCYMTRHGAGPMVSYSEEMTRSINETHNSAGSEWLGEFRNGHYDIVAMKYAVEISGGKQSFDGLSISYLDVLSNFNEWQICEAYSYEGKETKLEDCFEIEDGLITGIKVCQNTRDESHYNHQLKLTRLLKECKPVLNTIRATENENLEEVFLSYVEEKIEIPVVMVARGPIAKDRQLRSGKNTLLKNN